MQAGESHKAVKLFKTVFDKVTESELSLGFVVPQKCSGLRGEGFRAGMSPYDTEYFSTQSL